MATNRSSGRSSGRRNARGGAPTSGRSRTSERQSSRARRERAAGSTSNHTRRRRNAGRAREREETEADTLENDRSRTATSGRYGHGRKGHQQAPPWLWALLGVVVLGVLGSFGYFLHSKRAKPHTKRNVHAERLEEVRHLLEQGRELGRKAINSDDPTTRKSAFREAQAKLERAGEIFDEVLSGPTYRDANGDLKPEYSRYEQLRADIQKELYYLNRARTIND